MTEIRCSLAVRLRRWADRLDPPQRDPYLLPIRPFMRSGHASFHHAGQLPNVHIVMGAGRGGGGGGLVRPSDGDGPTAVGCR